MRYQTMLINRTREAVETLFRNARAVPADKIDWVPMGDARTVLSMLQECAYAPNHFIPILETKQTPASMTPDSYKESFVIRAQWTTIDECEKVCKENTERMLAIIDAMTDEDMEIIVPLPYGRGMNKSLADLANMHLANLIYHNGQIAYIQTMLGDREMH